MMNSNPLKKLQNRFYKKSYRQKVNEFPCFHLFSTFCGQKF
jgi:hypothetical protein